MNDHSPQLALLEKIKKNAQLNKHIHFSACKRKRRYYVLFGLPIVIISLVSGYIVSSPDFSESPDNTGLVSILMFSVALLSAIQTFFNFEKQSEGHQRIGNCLLKVARECDFYMANFKESLMNDKELSDINRKIMDEVNAVYKSAESLVVSDRDFRSAQKKQSLKENIGG